MGEHECPRCQYYVNWEEVGDEDREWMEEDAIRLIVLCGEGLSKNTIRRQMNVSMDRINDKIKDLVDQKRVIYQKKKAKQDKKQKDDDSESECNDNQRRKKKKKRKKAKKKPKAPQKKKKKKKKKK